MSQKHRAQYQHMHVLSHTVPAKRRAMKDKESKPGRCVQEEPLTVETNKTTEEIDLREEDARELIRKHRAFLGDSNIVRLSVGPKEVNGMKTNRLALIFGVVEKKGISELSKQSRIIPKEVSLERKQDGQAKFIPTDVVQTGRLVFNKPEGGSAICVETGHDSIPSLTVGTLGAILPGMFGGDALTKTKTGKKKLQLITCAHLIDFEEEYIGRELRYLERDRLASLKGSGQILEEFYRDQVLFRVKGFYPVKKCRKVDEKVFNEFDILFADVLDPEKVSETVLGEPHGGIGEARKNQEFSLAGIASGEHKSTITGFPLDEIKVEGEDSNGEYYMFWKNMIKYDLPTRYGDSGAALISEPDRKIIGLHTISSAAGRMGFACQVPPNLIEGQFFGKT